MNPYLINTEFENRLAEWCGSKYCVTTDSGTSSIFLSLMYRKLVDKVSGYIVELPHKTYPSVACSAIHAGFKIRFSKKEWDGEYQINWLDIWDAALRFKKNMYHGGFQCLSFHIKKLLPISRGGAILTDDENAAKWFRKARFDGRNPIPLLQDSFDMLGWNCYLTPEQAARGIQLFEALRQKYPDGMEDLKVEDQGYADLSKFDVYKQ